MALVSALMLMHAHEHEREDEDSEEDNYDGEDDADKSLASAGGKMIDGGDSVRVVCMDPANDFADSVLAAAPNRDNAAVVTTLEAAIASVQGQVWCMHS